MNYQMTINLLALKGAEETEINGVKGIFVPIEHNVYVGEKGAYVGLQAIEYKKMMRGCTHWMQRATQSKEDSEEQMRLRRENKLPYYGMMKPLFFKKNDK